MDAKIVFLILGMTAVTYIPRMLPMMIVTKRELPEVFREWLKFIPVSIFSALVFPEIFKGKNGFEFTIFSPQALAGFVCVFVIVKSRSLGATVIAGIISFMILNSIL